MQVALCDGGLALLGGLCHLSRRFEVPRVFALGIALCLGIGAFLLALALLFLFRLLALAPLILFQRAVGELCVFGLSGLPLAPVGLVLLCKQVLFRVVDRELLFHLPPDFVTQHLRLDVPAVI